MKTPFAKAISQTPQLLVDQAKKIPVSINSRLKLLNLDTDYLNPDLVKQRIQQYNLYHRVANQLTSQRFMTSLLVAVNLVFVGVVAASEYQYPTQPTQPIDNMITQPIASEKSSTITVKSPDAQIASVNSVKVTPTPTPAPTPTPTRQVAGVSISRVSGDKQDWMRQAGIPESVWGCVDALVRRESGWRVNATNAYSGAYGLPQALPGNKMAKMGADWQYNPVTQLRWMQSYVKARYGGFCQARDFQMSRGWY